MYIKVINQSTAGGSKLSLVCPNCGRGGTFDPIESVPDLHVPGYWLGHRCCPNPKCYSHLFFITNDQYQVLKTYPSLKIGFDRSTIPQRIVETLVEAIICHSEKCFMASAIMVRRCLEELCEERGATGSNLKERIGNLRSSVLLPSELFEAMEELRLLGNDAAHIEAKVYDQVGEAEVSLAIELTEEILKSVYQLDTLVKKLQGLKANKP